MIFLLTNDSKLAGVLQEKLNHTFPASFLYLGKLAYEYKR